MRRSTINRRRPGPPRRGRLLDRKYLKWISSQPCMICERRPTEVAHVGTRGLGQKCSDRETVPLCPEHHRVGKLSHHVLGKKFWDHWQMDRDETIAKYQALYAEEIG